MPRSTWPDPAAYDATAKKLARLFRDNFKNYDRPGSELAAAGPRPD